MPVYVLLKGQNNTNLVFKLFAFNIILKIFSFAINKTYALFIFGCNEIYFNCLQVKESHEQYHKFMFFSWIFRYFIFI